MLTAILYTSNSGYTKRYAELLAQRTGLPAYNAKNAVPSAVRGCDVLYLGWLMAGNVQGYRKAASKYNIRALCAVGMAPKAQDQTAEIKKRLGLTDTPVFYLQGGFNMQKLHGCVYRLMMRVMVKKILSDMEKLDSRTPEQETLYQMATTGLDCVSEENLSDVLHWYAAL